MFFIPFSSLRKRFGVIIIALMVGPALFAQAVSKDTLLQDLAFFQEEIKKNPNDPNLYFDMASVYSRLNDLIGAQKCLVKALYLNPKDNEALLSLGQIRRRTGQLFLARETLEKLLARDPKNVDGWVELGYALCDSGIFDESVKAFQRAARLPPTPGSLELPKIRFYIGVLELARGNRKSANEELSWLRENKSEFAVSLEKLSSLAE